MVEGPPGAAGDMIVRMPCSACGAEEMHPDRVQKAVGIHPNYQGEIADLPRLRGGGTQLVE